MTDEVFDPALIALSYWPGRFCCQFFKSAAASVTLWLGLYSAFASAFSTSLRLLRPAVL